MEELLINSVANIGIPAIIAFYMLFKVNSTLEKLTKAIYELTAKIDTHISIR